MAATIKPKIYTAKALNLDTSTISPQAVDICSTLQAANYEAYIVGGGVRDCLLGLTPKDFDIATNATPEQIKTLFKNCRLIGKRFRLAHIFFKHFIIEVATFRADHSQAILPESAHTKNGMIIRDNVYGTLDEDAFRRDFTVNALYYDPINGIVKDFAQGIPDLKSRCIRMIGKPLQRYYEDPLRILRAIRFSTKLDCTIEPNTLKAIKPAQSRLQDIPAPRRFDEYLKLFLHGQAKQNFMTLNNSGLLQYLFPNSVDYISTPKWLHFFENAMHNTDLRLSQEKGVHPGFLLAVLLWPKLLERQAELIQQGLTGIEAHRQAASETLSQQQRHTAAPKRFQQMIQDVWFLQHPLENYRTKRKVKHYLHHPRFRAAYDFLLLRAEIEGCHAESVQWWTDAQKTPPASE